MLAKWMKNTVKDFWKFNLPLYRKGDRLWGMRGAVGDYQEGRKTLFNQGLFELSSTQKERLGTKRELDDGRVFVYGLTTAVEIAAGCLVSKSQTPVDATVAAADAALALAGARSVSLTAAGITAAYLKDGIAMVKAGTDIGSMYKIRGNGTTSGIATGRIALELYDKIHVTWVAASTTVALHYNPWKDLVINIAQSASGQVWEVALGLTTQIVTVSSYAWFQKEGIGALICDGAFGDTNEEPQVLPGTTAGHGLLTEAGILGQQIIGHLVECVAATAAETQLVNLHL